MQSGLLCTYSNLASMRYLVLRHSNAEQGPAVSYDLGSSGVKISPSGLVRCQLPNWAAGRALKAVRVTAVQTSTGMSLSPARLETRAWGCTCRGASDFVQQSMVGTPAMLLYGIADQELCGQLGGRPPPLPPTSPPPPPPFVISVLKPPGASGALY